METTELFFSLMRNAVYGGGFDEGRVQEKISEIVTMAKNFNLLPLLYPVLSKYENICENSVKMDVLRQMSVHRATYLIAKESKKNGIFPVFFKGPVLADLYPHYTQRMSLDIDLFVPADEKSEVVKMLEGLGFFGDPGDFDKFVQKFFKGDSGVQLELHTRLWGEHTGKKINALESMCITDATVTAPLRGFDIRTLEPGRHLTYHMFHIVKHFMTSGLSIRELLDVSLFIKKYKEKIDFEIFWNQMETLGYTFFCKKFFSLCSYYLEEENAPMPDENAHAILADMINGGVNGFEKKYNNWQIGGIIAPYMSGKPRTKFFYPRSFAFYAKRYLLDREHNFNPVKVYTTARRRLKFLKKLGLVDG